MITRELNTCNRAHVKGNRPNFEIEDSYEKHSKTQVIRLLKSSSN